MYSFTLSTVSHTVNTPHSEENHRDLEWHDNNFWVTYPFKMFVYICDLYSKVMVGGASGSNLLFMDMKLTLPHLDWNSDSYLEH